MTDRKLTPTEWRWADESGAGIQFYAKVPFEAHCGEFITKANFDQPVFQLHIPNYGHVFTDKKLSHEMMMGYEQWIQFEPNDWMEMQKQNAELLITCANSCLEINHDNPLVVAQSIKEMYDCVKEMIASSSLQPTDDKEHPYILRISYESFKKACDCMHKVQSEKEVKD